MDDWILEVAIHAFVQLRLVQQLCQLLQVSGLTLATHVLLASYFNYFSALCLSLPLNAS